MNTRNRIAMAVLFGAAAVGCTGSRQDQIVTIESETRVGFSKTTTFNCRTEELRTEESDVLVAGRAVMGGVKTKTALVHDPELLARYKAICKNRFSEPAPAAGK